MSSVVAGPSSAGLISDHPEEASLVRSKDRTQPPAPDAPRASRRLAIIDKGVEISDRNECPVAARIASQFEERFPLHTRNKLVTPPTKKIAFLPPNSPARPSYTTKFEQAGSRNNVASSGRTSGNTKGLDNLSGISQLARPPQLPPWRSVQSVISAGASASADGTGRIGGSGHVASKRGGQMRPIRQRRSLKFQGISKELSRARTAGITPKGALYEKVNENRPITNHAEGPTSPSEPEKVPAEGNPKNNGRATVQQAHPSHTIQSFDGVNVVSEREIEEGEAGVACESDSDDGLYTLLDNPADVDFVPETPVVPEPHRRTIATRSQVAIWNMPPLVDHDIDARSFKDDDEDGSEDGYDLDD